MSKLFRRGILLALVGVPLLTPASTAFYGEVGVVQAQQIIEDGGMRKVLLDPVDGSVHCHDSGSNCHV